jgi:D-amino-acid oxidase
LEQKFEVTIVARELPPHTTSNKAAAIWYPYKVQPEDRALVWAEASLVEFYRLAARGEGGVSLIKVVELFHHPAADPWWKEAVRSFEPLAPADLPPGYQAGIMIEAPLIETPLYMPYLLARFQQLGGQLEQRTVASLAELTEASQLIINCTGLGAAELTHDSQVYPIRGQIVRVVTPRLPHSFMLETEPHLPTYIIPRRDDCILGGTAQEHNDSLEVDLPTADHILTACRQLEPLLTQARVVEHLVGLRPGRSKVRLEVEQLSPGCTVIHNYGHGGAGFTLSWGCAQEVTRLALANL